MTNRQWLDTLSYVTDTLILNCCCASSKCEANDCSICKEKWLESEHGECRMYEIAEEQDKMRC